MPSIVFSTFKHPLQLHLLGNFHLTREDGVTSSFRSDKERALLAYLAARPGEYHPRAALAGLLWPEAPEDMASNNLRVTLHRLRTIIGDPSAQQPVLEISREAVRLIPHGDLWVDLAAFEELLARASQHDHGKRSTCRQCMGWYADAVRLYRGDFLHGLTPSESQPFSFWTLNLRENLHGKALQALHLLTDYHQRRGELDLAFDYAHRQLELEPWREEAHCQLMTILAQRGERSAALRQYDRCRRVLMQELGVEPSETTRSLYQRILAARNSRRHNLPVQPAFIGRKNELNQVGDALADPDCRLLTLLGPGGIGKSRLALQAAENQAYAHLHGVYWVDLAGVDSVIGLISAIGNSLDLKVHPARQPKQLLFNFLHQKEMLLVLDNFTSLLQREKAREHAQVLKDMLAAAPGVRLLVTSRQRLGLRREWIVSVPGLQVPGDSDGPEVEAFEAVQLFLSTIRRTNPGFMPSRNTEWQAIARINRLLEGVPLAIEMAAAWTWEMPVEQIVQEIEGKLDFLNSTELDVALRYSSLQSNIEHSGEVPSPEEKTIMRRLSIFSGRKDRLHELDVSGALR